MTKTKAQNAPGTRTSQPDSHGVWFPGLDGVRGIAIGLVFMVHYLRRGGHIGWMGVLIFFVLSGFLITGVLFNGRNETHRFRNFYIRRTLRIFPLFYFIWLLALLGSPFLQRTMASSPGALACIPGKLRPFHRRYERSGPYLHKVSVLPD